MLPLIYLANIMLVNWTHDEAGPWFKSTNGGKSLQKEIPDNLISDYFKTLIRPVN